MTDTAAAAAAAAAVTMLCPCPILLSGFVRPENRSPVSGFSVCCCSYIQTEREATIKKEMLEGAKGLQDSLPKIYITFDDHKRNLLSSFTLYFGNV